MIIDYADKKLRKKIKAEKSEAGNVIFSEEKFNEDDGVKYFKVAIETNPQHLDIMKEDLTRRLESQKAEVAGTQAQIIAINEMMRDVKALITEPPTPAMAAIDTDTKKKSIAKKNIKQQENK